MITISQSTRLRKKAEIDNVFAHKNSVGTKHFVLYFAENKNENEGARLATVISKRCSKLAVVRNRIRRQVREYFRQNYVLVGPYDCVVIARHAAPKLSNVECKQSLETLFGRFLKYRHKP